ncbi:MAG: hypothetical protein LLF78_06380 [Synergistaceae bacterium]|nr:hypothetical protein [Synergistaceae bacterium]
MEYAEARKINEEITELCRDQKHPSRIMAREVMRSLNAEMEQARKRSGGFQRNKSPKSRQPLNQTQSFYSNKTRGFTIDVKAEARLLKALEKAKESRGITEDRPEVSDYE